MKTERKPQAQAKEKDRKVSLGTALGFVAIDSRKSRNWRSGR